MFKQALCIGEVLWDALPGGLFLGGAPFNVSCHLQMLGCPVTMASRIGNDEPGRRIARQMEQRGMTTVCLQVDPDLSTGLVKVSFSEDHQPSYEIVDPSAWDRISLDSPLCNAAENADVLVFGSLAQRNHVSRDTIRSLLVGNTYNVFDVNLRPPYVDREIVRNSIEAADLVKLNEEELQLLSSWYSLPSGLRAGTAALAHKFDCQTVCVTRGANGAALWHGETWHQHAGYAIEARDPVGAGDAFLAALLSGLMAGNAGERLLARANAVGAFVAGSDGATPKLNLTAIEAYLMD